MATAKKTAKKTAAKKPVAKKATPAKAAKPAKPKVYKTVAALAKAYASGELSKSARAEALGEQVVVNVAQGKNQPAFVSFQMDGTTFAKQLAQVAGIPFRHTAPVAPAV